MENLRKGEEEEVVIPLEQRDAKDVELHLLGTEMKVKNMMLSFNGLVDQCFNSCVTNFRSPVLTQKEESCLRGCTDKYFQFRYVLGREVLQMQSDIEEISNFTNNNKNNNK